MKSCAAAGVNPRDTYAWNPSSGSPAEADAEFVDDLLSEYTVAHELVSLEFAETNPFRNSVIWGIGLLAQCVRTAVDRLYGIADCLDSSRTIRAPLTMSRTVLEAAATACFVSEPDLDHRERLRRAHNLRMEDKREGANHRDESDAADYLQSLAELVSFAEHSDLKVRMSRLAHEAPQIPPESNERESIRELIERTLPGAGLSTYRNLSVVAHCRPSVGDILPGDYSLHHEVAVWRKTEKIASYLLPTLISVHAMAGRVAQYLGWDDHQIQTTIEKVADFISISAG